MAKDLQFIMLLDCYGEFLTERQRQVTELYYGEDLSLGEISEISGITRQAVRDSIKRSEEILLDMEEKLRFAERLGKLREKFSEIAEAARTVSSETADNPAAQEKCRRIEACVQESLKLL
ncbi:MAG: DNA-binding protein [Oscillospiraceae bacterium]|nr:DNA-binding protein [Oscillospiraceae bacterium]